MLLYSLLKSFFILFVIYQGVNGIYVKTQASYNKIWPKTTTVQPVFEPTPLSVTVRVGETAQLPCKVRNLGDRVVSWIRRTDLGIISSGPFIFTTDKRFNVIRPIEEEKSWTLQLRNVKDDDEGLYECQVNSDPKLKQAILLSVSDELEAMELLRDDSSIYGNEGTVILGQKERYVKVGSRLVLTCHSRAMDFPQSGQQRPPRLVEWLHDDAIIIFDHTRTGVSVDTEKEGKDVSSHLSLATVSISDSGKYTCKPFNSDPYSILLVVVEAERTEAIKSDAISNSNNLLPSLVQITAVTLLFLKEFL